MAAEATRTAGIGRRASGSHERGAKSSGAGMCGWRPAGGAGGGAGGVVEVLSSPLTSGGDGGGVLPSPPLPLAPSLAVWTSAGGMYPGEGSEAPAPTEHEYGIGGIGIDITVTTGIIGVAATGITTAIGTATAIGRACVGGGTGWCGGAGAGIEAGAARDIQPGAAPPWLANEEAAPPSRRSGGDASPISAEAAHASAAAADGVR